MENINLSAYYDKISDIRAKILSKHKDPSGGSKSKYEREEVLSGNFNQYQDTKRPAIGEQLRRPLQNRAQNDAHVSDRLKQLDSVNDRIRKMLANKREPTSSNAHRNISSYSKTNNIQSTPKRITSLFENQNKILESKVAPPLANWASNKDRNNLYKQPNPSYNRDTIESRLYTNQENNQFLQKRYKKQVNQTSDKFDFSFDKVASFERKYSIEYKLEPISSDKQHKEEEIKTSINRDQALIKKSALNTDKIFTYQPSKKSIIVNGFYGKTETKRLVELMTHQIELDATLRQQKQKFDNVHGQQKYKRLEDEIKTLGILMNFSQIQTWAKLSPEQCNPFLEITTQQNFSYVEFANKLVEAQTHWSMQLKQSVSISKLQNEGFKIQEIDLGGKGYLTIQDFVCFINLNSDSCLRNRDVFSMFHRWNKDEGRQKFENRLQYETFLNFVAK